jgi:hypothetical protein
MADIRALEELAKFLFISILIDREGFTPKPIRHEYLRWGRTLQVSREGI